MQDTCTVSAVSAKLNISFCLLMSVRDLSTSFLLKGHLKALNPNCLILSFPCPVSNFVASPFNSVQHCWMRPSGWLRRPKTDNSADPRSLGQIPYISQDILEGRHFIAETTNFFSSVLHSRVVALAETKDLSRNLNKGNNTCSRTDSIHAISNRVLAIARWNEQTPVYRSCCHRLPATWWEDLVRHDKIGLGSENFNLSIRM